MIDLQRGHLARPAVDGWWCAIRCAINRAGTSDSCSTTACAVELELWPSQPSISRRSSFSPLSSASQHDDAADFHSDQYHPATTSRGLGQRDSGRFCIDTFSSHRHMVNDFKTVLSPPNSPLRPIHRADSFESIASGASTLTLGAGDANNEESGATYPQPGDNGLRVASPKVVRERGAVTKRARLAGGATGAEPSHFNKPLGIQRKPPGTKMSSRQPPTTSRPPRPIRRGAAPAAPGPSGGSSWTTPKRLIWTGAFAAVTIVGSIYGAGLKTQQEYSAEKKKILETPIEDRIRELEARRAQLVTQKRPLERKLEQLRLRVQKENDNASPEKTDGR
ncbi:hypothetical protein GQX73_g3080 [Xylaria multiplex]|uniref:Uncharacterized protein n=1 Tax=Xylaria multiplex TaxID=323545 RepID=A0A7C8IY09_9PEZI|nr:hypothetical protein GQX73_g3080 [Xylaria multiplex]